MLRAVRFAAQLNFEIEPETFARHPNARAENQNHQRRARAGRIDEIISVRRTPRAAWFCCATADCWNTFCRNWRRRLACEQSPDFHPEGSVFNHICLMLEKMPAGANESLPWAVLLHDIAKPVTAERDAATGKIHFYGHEKVGAEMAEKILQRLRFPKKQIGRNRGVRPKSHAVQGREADAQGDAAAVADARDVSAGTGTAPAGLPRLVSAIWSIINFLLEQAEELKHQPAIRPPLLTGNDLIKLGMKPGKALGALLHEIREQQLADELKTPREAKAWVRKKLQSDG